MKKLTLILITLLALTLSACGGASDSTGAATTSQTDPSAQTLSGASLLIIGTFKLEGTGQAVTSEQASELLPLWQVYQSLSTSDTAASEEVDALVEQIQTTMTSEQMQAIEEMQLTQEDVFALMQEQGIEMGAGPGAERMATAQAGGGGFTPPDGGFPGGGGPGQGPGDGGGQGLTPDQIATAQASRGAGGVNPNRVPTALIEALIEFLQEKAGA